MKIFLHLLIFAFFFSLVACNKEKEIVIDNDWIASSIRFENGDFSSPDSQYHFTIENKNLFSLRLDVNLCRGTVYFRKKSVVFKSIGCTEACCDSEFAIAIIDNLNKAKYWEVSNNQLVLTNDKGLKIVFDEK